MSESNLHIDPASEESLDTRLVRELAEVLNATGLTEIEVEREHLRIRVVKSSNVTHTVASAPAHTVHVAPPVEVAPAPTASKAAGDAVKSPMVGTVYLQSQPGAPPFAKVGDRVTQGQTLMLVEAMKTMNPIGAPRDGVVAEILVSDGQPVEYGEPLVVLG